MVHDYIIESLDPRNAILFNHSQNPVPIAQIINLVVLLCVSSHSQLQRLRDLLLSFGHIEPLLDALTLLSRRDQHLVYRAKDLLGLCDAVHVILFPHLLHQDYGLLNLRHPGLANSDNGRRNGRLKNDVQDEAPVRAVAEKIVLRPLGERLVRELAHRVCGNSVDDEIVVAVE